MSSEEAPAAPLPCQKRNNGTESTKETRRKGASTHQKTAYALKENIRHLVNKQGISNVGFLTITFTPQIHNITRAQRKFKSVATHVLTPRYHAWIAVLQRHASGAIHFHVIFAAGKDIRTGIDFAAIKRKDYSSATKELRAEWDFWRTIKRRYKLGRIEALPVKKNADALADYSSQYIEKHIGKRRTEDKGARLVRYSKGANIVRGQFSIRSVGNDLWRAKLATLATALGLTADGYASALKGWFGPRWAHTLSPIIHSVKLAEYPTTQHCFQDRGIQQLPAGISPNNKGCIVMQDELAASTLWVAKLTVIDERMRRRQ